jgi:hypothetical protein
MHIITRKTHAVLDYFSAIALIGIPWALNFHELKIATQILVGAGILIAIMSDMKNYEGGIARFIPMSVHLNMDILLGILLIASPWLFGFSDAIYLPHVIAGLYAILSGLLTVRSSLNYKQVRN